MKPTVVDHIGIAVKSIDEALKFWQDSLGIKCTGVEEVAEQRVKTAFLPLGDTEVELLEATSDESPVAKFIEKKGEGIHHMAFHVDDIEAAIKEAVELEIVPLTKEAQPGASGTRVVFLHPKSAGGVLIELVEGSH